MLQKKIYSTSTTRFANIIKLYDNYRPRVINYLTHKLHIKLKKKIFYKTPNFLVTPAHYLNTAGVTFSYTYNKKPYQSLMNIYTIFNQSLVIPGVEFLLPGKKIFNLTKSLNFKKISYLGSQVLLRDLPHHLFICFITNNYNNKWTYAKSSGTFGTKLKGKKTIKLVLVKLPSGFVFFFLNNIKCFVGKNYNFFNNKFVEGKWGYSIHKTKRLCVRGVAMNPVDHPNGGRTKAKQPEKSPWGWIAKNKK